MQIKKTNIKYIENKNIDKAKWDNTITHSHNGLIYAYSWYLDIVSDNWDALINDDYSIIFPLTYKKKYSIQYLYQPIFSQQLGIFSINKLKQETINLFIESIPDKFKFIEINLNINNFTNLSNYKISKRITYLLNLNENYESVKKKYSENTLRNIKKAEKNNIRIDINNSIKDELIEFFISNTLKHDKSVTPKDFERLKQLVSIIIDKNNGQFYCGYANNNLCACAFFINSNNKSIYLFSSANELAKKYGVMHKLIDTYISNNANQNLILDFEGSNIPSIARFYESFNATRNEYLHLKKNKLPKIISWIK